VTRSAIVLAIARIVRSALVCVREPSVPGRDRVVGAGVPTDFIDGSVCTMRASGNR